MSEATHYWPVQPGVYTVESRHGAKRTMVLPASRWDCPGEFVCRTTIDLQGDGWLGVRREAEKADNAATAREARQELSMCRKPAEFERWAIKWGPTLCEIAGAS
jgi:hypothetical protein